MGSPANTLTNHYLSVMTKTTACQNDLKQIIRHCQPEPDPEKDDKEKGKAASKPLKKKSIANSLKKSMEVLDDKGKALMGYNRDKVGTKPDPKKAPFTGNAWIDDHCTGLWVPPYESDEAAEFLKNMPEEMKKSRAILEDTLTGYRNKLSNVKELFGEMSEVASDLGMGDLAQDMATKFAAKTAVKVGVGVVGVETILVPIAMAAWTAYDAVNMVSELATFMGDKGKAYMEVLDNLKDADKKLDQLAQDFKDKPLKGYTNTMKYVAMLNPCIRARKCLLVPYNKTASDGKDDPTRISENTGKPLKNSKGKSQAKHGEGCCPGQTGHHIMPDAMFENVDCPGYNYGEAPTMCLEGTSNNEGWGSHGDAHGNLKTTMKQYRETENKRTGGDPDTIAYDNARDEGIDAARKSAALQCDPDCLKAQIDEHYQQCKQKDGSSAKLRPADGGGKFIEMKPKDAPKSTPTR